MSLLIRYIDVKHADKLFFFFFPYLFIYNFLESYYIYILVANLCNAQENY
jgi:hypothetical protein